MSGRRRKDYNKVKILIFVEWPKSFPVSYTIVKYRAYIILTTEVPSWNLVLNTLLAFVNIPSFKDTTIN